VINVADYWPIPQPGHTIVKTFNNNYSQVIESAPEGGAYLVETQNNIWQDTWHYKYDHGRGILEDYDLYPGGKRTQMQGGKEIIWGSRVNVGDVVQGQCEIIGILGIGNQFGWQKVQFDAVIPTVTLPSGVVLTDVLEIEYWQYWESMGPAGGDLSKGAKIFLAKGIGFIQELWTSNGVPTGDSIALQSFEIK
jgi:hypothetical protein